MNRTARKAKDVLIQLDNSKETTKTYFVITTGTYCPKCVSDPVPLDPDNTPLRGQVIAVIFDGKFTLALGESGVHVFDEEFGDVGGNRPQLRGPAMVPSTIDAWDDFIPCAEYKGQDTVHNGLVESFKPIALKLRAAAKCAYRGLGKVFTFSTNKNINTDL